ncbi:GNAT family N-acetyltransferase [Bradyrhizobium sp. SYSU BS000235]|uniref:GNAT family N-acetyltransferase n=1 Tax=Bradyrhizobium sp. SYSU BS000235 TaxID=3411332 RepID=UPI003C77B5FB
MTSIISDATSASFSLRIVTRAELQDCDAWKSAFRDSRKDHRYYEIVEDTLRDRFEYGYLAIVDAVGIIRAVQPFFLLDQDLLEGLGSEWRLVSFVRRRYPRLFKLRTMMVGCSAGEGHLAEAGDLPPALIAKVLSDGIVQIARSIRAYMIVLKEFPAEYRKPFGCFLEKGFTRIPSMPMTIMDTGGFPDFDAYALAKLSGQTRRQLRKNFKATEGIEISMRVTDDVGGSVGEIYRLYLQVFERSKLRFEELTEDYFRALGKRMSDKTRFFSWRRDNALVAFALCMVESDQLFYEYVGLDYAVALDFHLYHYVTRDLFNWAVANRYTCIRSTGLNYEPKLRFRHRLDPIDLYVRHTSLLANAVLRRVLPRIVPARYDPVLQRFPDYNSLW